MAKLNKLEIIDRLMKLLNTTDETVLDDMFNTYDRKRYNYLCMLYKQKLAEVKSNKLNTTL